MEPTLICEHVLVGPPTDFVNTSGKAGTSARLPTVLHLKGGFSGLEGRGDRRRYMVLGNKQACMETIDTVVKSGVYARSEYELQAEVDWNSLTIRVHNWGTDRGGYWIDEVTLTVTRQSDEETKSLEFDVPSALTGSTHSRDTKSLDAPFIRPETDYKLDGDVGFGGTVTTPAASLTDKDIEMACSAPDEVSVGETFEVTGTVTNTIESVPVNTAVKLEVGGERSSKEVSIDGGGEATITFEVTPEKAGELKPSLSVEQVSTAFE